MPLPLIRLKFVGFWDGFDTHENVFTRLLARGHRVEICDDPDFIIYSYIGRRRRDFFQYDCVRIFFTGENIPPDWNACDWAFTFEHTTHPRHFRLPLWGLYGDPAALVKPLDYDPDAVLARKTKFCGFVVSNPLCRVRNEFFRKLSKYKPVDSGGKVLNTLGHRVGDKQAFLADYKFTITFENESHPGYTTEKLVDPMVAGSVPIYWGDPLVGRDFDTRSFISAHDSGTLHRGWLDDLVERVVEVDRNPDLHREMLARPWLRDNRVPACVDPEVILEQFTRIFATPVEPVARRRGLGRMIGLHRIPAELASIRRRIKRKWWKLTRTA
ncbi:MAG: glycosyltransferase family 10 [Planctomycetia bacterium]|nr:glycosyltransferase family 10 [Planctomycetia bacterium]